MNPKKCHIAKKEHKFLGYMVNIEGIFMDPCKVEAVRNFPTPTNLRQLRRFLGLASYYRRFIRDFSKLATPLHLLLKKNTKVGIDIIGPLPPTKIGNKYIVVATEYLTRWPEARAMSDTSAPSVASFIIEDIICRHGSPRELLSDQGKHFDNNLVEAICTQLKCTIQFSGDWDQRDTILTEEVAEITLKIPPVNKQDLQENILRRVKVLLEELPQAQFDARERTLKAQLRHKERHDKRYRIESYSIGKKKHKGKLEEKWEGPFYVHNVLEKGAYKLRTLDDKGLRDLEGDPVTVVT
ncbi:27017_t:CDS:2 [Dentiscutata erythropus]|uniref:27017_t:CDS:1 n=1 Tax=Dentiscutata erythropus TaxID=1348616 RepID=A0A9N9HT92_9GLOM|nr:27017_t:CDS:2 [Dentiscutata erythropus]